MTMTENEKLEAENKRLAEELEKAEAYIDNLMERETDAGGEIEQLQIENAKLKQVLKVSENRGYFINWVIEHHAAIVTEYLERE